MDENTSNNQQPTPEIVPPVLPTAPILPTSSKPTPLANQAEIKPAVPTPSVAPVLPSTPAPTPTPRVSSVAPKKISPMIPKVSAPAPMVSSANPKVSKLGVLADCLAAVVSISFAVLILLDI